jgi:hypothetical protein
MIDINTAANIAEIAGGIAILVSLAYVGYQVRQSNRIASASALQSVLDRFSDRSINQYMEHPETTGILARGHNSLDKLSPDEAALFAVWQLREVFHMHNIMQLHTSGLLSDVDYQTWLSFTVAQVKTPGGHEVWNNQRITLNPTVAEIIETYIKENPQAPSFIELFPQTYGENAHYLKSKDGPNA